ncbi:MAG TPA: DciA family protein [Pseudolabrys sp.]|nr:DciA family protein [Pseudolabrys sp.]
MNKPSRTFPRPLSELIGAALSEGLARQGFASTELITRWNDIAGAEIAAHSEPIKVQWPRSTDGADPAPATLVLRVEGPMALEIQHLSAVILERVNRFFGWQAIGRIALRQAPLRRKERPVRPALDAKAVKHLAAALPTLEDENLRQAIARLGVAIKRK